nr:unnamed protein product [Callosobruchus chinensis]
MPRKGIKYCQWSEQDMKAAIGKYKSGKFGLNEICRRYNIPKPTFKRHLLGTNTKAKAGIKSLGRLNVFSAEIEQDLENQILKMEECFFGLTIRDIRRAAFQFAEKNDIPHSFNKQKGMAGKAWYYNFMKRYPKLSLRQPESTSLARCKGFSRENVNHFYVILENLVDQYKIDSTKIYNVDESGFSTVQKKSQKIVSRKGKKNVGTVASRERGVNTTFIVSANAAGHFAAPMIIFKRKRMMAELGVGAPPGCLVQISDTGYINTELFVVWLREFIEVVRPTPENKVILVLDGHTTHSKNLEAINLAREHGVILLQLPGHTTNRLQPLDVAIFKPMEVYYYQAVERWMREYPGLAVTQHQVAKLLGEAFGKAAPVGFAMNEFSKCGIWPVVRHVFNDVDFAASDALLKNAAQLLPEVDENQNEQAENDSSADDIPLSRIISKDGHLNKNTSFEEMNCLPRPGGSVDKRQEHGNVRQQAAIGSLNISFEELIRLPGPSGLGSKHRISKNAQQAAVLTASPYKEELEKRKSAVNNKAKSAVKRAIGLDLPKKTKGNTTVTKRTHSRDALSTAEVVEVTDGCHRDRSWRLVLRPLPGMPGGGYGQVYPMYKLGA